MKNNIFTTKLLDVILAKKENKPFSKSKGIFLVMEYIPNDVKRMLDTISPTNFSEDHVRIILYNTLCSINYIGSSGLMHRDIKPMNILIDSNCLVKICDFGLSRTIP